MIAENWGWGAREVLAMPLSRRRHAVRFLERNNEKSRLASKEGDSSHLSWRLEDYQWVWQVELEATLTQED